MLEEENNKYIIQILLNIFTTIIIMAIIMTFDIDLRFLG